MRFYVLDFSHTLHVRNIFKTKRTLKVHKLKCKSDKIYKCDECDDIFESYSKLVVHRENKHRTVQCEICEVEIYFKNIQRHMKTHKGLTPAKTAMMFKKKVQEKNQKHCI